MQLPPSEQSDSLTMSYSTEDDSGLTSDEILNVYIDRQRGDV